MNGAIDIHVHHGPESVQERRQSALETACSARDLGMRAIVLKNHEYNSVPLAKLVSELVPEVQTFGGLTLDNDTGGLNPAAALVAARMGAKIIWMPTLTSANTKEVFEGLTGLELHGEEIDILDANGKLKAEVKEILQILKEYDVALASGHVTPKETFTLVEEAQRIGLTRIVVTHPLQQPLFATLFTMDELKQLAKSGVYIEHCFWGCMPPIGTTIPKTLVDATNELGAENCIMSTDFGMEYYPSAPEGLRLFVATMLKKGLTEQQVELMVKTNPARLLGLD
jgi:hypothetical protein